MVIKSNHIDKFMKSLDLPEESRVLFQTIGDCHSFYITYYGRSKSSFDDILNYREKKLESVNISLESFICMCDKEGIKSAFEETFLQAFDVGQVSIIEIALSTGKTTLEAIYNTFQKNPNKNILRNVL